MNRVVGPDQSSVENVGTVSAIAPRGREGELRRLMPLLERGEHSVEYRRELAERLEQDPQLAAAFARWQECWDDLELPPAAAAPLGFASRLTAQVRSRAEGELSWSSAPRWARLAAATALVVGTLSGVSFGLWQSESREAGELANPGSLAQDYWLLLEDGGAEERADEGEALR